MTDCKTCGIEIVRKRYPSGKLENLAKFRMRKYCSQPCYLKDTNSAKVDLIEKTCKECGDIFTRKVYPSGAKEPATQFNARVFCSTSCHTENMRNLRDLETDEALEYEGYALAAENKDLLNKLDELVRENGSVGSSRWWR